VQVLERRIVEALQVQAADFRAERGLRRHDLEPCLLPIPDTCGGHDRAKLANDMSGVNDDAPREANGRASFPAGYTSTGRHHGHAPPLRVLQL
jgi:hypothetical protein